MVIFFIFVLFWNLLYINFINVFWIKVESWFQYFFFFVLYNKTFFNIYSIFEIYGNNEICLNGGGNISSWIWLLLEGKQGIFLKVQFWCKFAWKPHQNCNLWKIENIHNYCPVLLQQDNIKWHIIIYYLKMGWLSLGCNYLQFRNTFWKKCDNIFDLCLPGCNWNQFEF